MEADLVPFGCLSEAEAHTIRYPNGGHHPLPCAALSGDGLAGRRQPQRGGDDGGEVRRPGSASGAASCPDWSRAGTLAKIPRQRRFSAPLSAARQIFDLVSFPQSFPRESGKLGFRLLKPRRGAGVVERGSLENCWRRKALVGSNPTPSAPLNSSLKQRAYARTAVFERMRAQAAVEKGRYGWGRRALRRSARLSWS